MFFISVYYYYCPPIFEDIAKIKFKLSFSYPFIMFGLFHGSLEYKTATFDPSLLCTFNIPAIIMGRWKDGLTAYISTTWAR